MHGKYPGKFSLRKTVTEKVTAFCTSDCTLLIWEVLLAVPMRGCLIKNYLTQKESTS